MRTRNLFIVAIGLCIASCSPSNTPAPTLEPTDPPELPTAAPTQTPEPTPTPKPTRTPIPKPTTTDVPTPMPTQMAILEGRWVSINQAGWDNVYIEYFPDGTYKMKSVEEGKFQSQGIFWFDDKYIYVKAITGEHCGDTVGVYEIKSSDQGTLVFMGWVDDCVERWMTYTTSTWEKR